MGTGVSEQTGHHKVNNVCSTVYTGKREEKRKRGESGSGKKAATIKHHHQ